MLIIVVAMLLVQFFYKRSLLYINKTISWKLFFKFNENKILTASNIIEGIIASLVSFLGAGLLTFTNTSNACIIIGATSFIILILLLEYMNSHVGLKPEEYKESEINFKEVE